LVSSLTHVEAIIILEIINSPTSKCVCVYSLIPQTPGIASTGVLPSVRVHAKTQPKGVEIVGHSSHAAGEFGGVSNERIVVAWVPPTTPAIVQNHIMIA
jgi:hypothetical protein